MRAQILAVALVSCLAPGAALAFFEPPIRNAQDAACRSEARAKVFTAPDPEGVGLFETGKRLYMSCMTASAKRGKQVANADASGR